MPRPPKRQFSRPSVSIAAQGTDKREWQYIRAWDVNVDDIVADYGLVVARKKWDRKISKYTTLRRIEVFFQSEKVETFSDDQILWAFSMARSE